jgi:putative nucleotidyltransferase with HDIG domain
VKRTLRLRGIGMPIKGKVWESDTLLRVGRLASLEIVLEDSSVSRKHGEVRTGTDGQWTVRDLESTNGTYVNGQRVDPGTEQPLRARDIVQFGKLAFLVELLETTPEGPPSDQLIVSATTGAAFEDGLKRIVFDRHQMPRAGDELIALLRAGHHLVHLQSEDQLLDSVLHDAVSVLDAQRGAIVLAEGDGAEPKLRLRALAVGVGENKGRFHFSKRLTLRCFAKGESLLYGNVQQDDELRLTQSIADGAMTSVICVLLRTPRRKLGVLHLDRGMLQHPFTEDDLLLADALAAHVSAGIEAAQLLKQQRDLFQKTIMMLAQMVELRDEYTGGHTQRVTRYSVMLAEKMGLPEDQIELVKVGTPLHDIGKVGIPDAILRKPGRLTPQEFAVMQTHTTVGAEYLMSIPELHPIIPIVRNHHERWDGTGYPDQLKGPDIPLSSRVMALVSVYEALRTRRPYRPALSHARAVRLIVSESSGNYDPVLVTAFAAAAARIEQVYQIPAQ